MSETLHNRPVGRDKLSAALKRNMARRKEVVSRQPVRHSLGEGGSPVASKEGAGGAASVTSPCGRGLNFPLEKIQGEGEAL